jgi:hypothetical protein
MRIRAGGEQGRSLQPLGAARSPHIAGGPDTQCLPAKQYAPPCDVPPEFYRTAAGDMATATKEEGERNSQSRQGKEVAVGEQLLV